MAYIVDVNNAADPVDARGAGQAAEELRAIKGKLNFCTVDGAGHVTFGAGRNLTTFGINNFQGNTTLGTGTGNNHTVNGALSITAAVYSPALTGMVAAFAMSTAPTGWLKANGAAVSRVTYSNLFSAIGVVFGAGDGSTTFNLPDLRGEFARGWDDARGIDTGRVFGSAQADEFKSHRHTVRMDSDVNGVISFNNGKAVSTANGLLPANSGTAQIDLAGGTETRPRNIALLFCIKF